MAVAALSLAAMLWHGVPAPPAEVEPEPAPVEEPALRSFTARISAYCLSGLTRLGTPVRRGVVSVDPAVIRLGSRLTIDGLPGVFVAEDTGVAIVGHRIDLYVPDCADAIRWGVQYRTVWIIE